jgi:serine/threonine protein kinase
MGIHTGPVHPTADSADRNLSGDGIKLAQRVTGVGDAGHILVSKAAAGILLDHDIWAPHLHDLGETAVKQGIVLHLFNLHAKGLGNPSIPSRFAGPPSKAPTITVDSQLSAAILVETTPSHGRGKKTLANALPGTGPSVPTPGMELLHYRLLEQIDDGGTGAVFAAEDTHLDRLVSLKFLPADQAGAAEANERLLNQARAVSALNHPNICAIFDAGEIDGLEYIAAELLEGHTLQHLMAESQITPAQIVRWAIQIADALEAAHTQGIVHRELNPGNIFINTSDDVKILDFGLTELTSHATPASSQRSPQARQDFASAGSQLSPVAYISPEQARGNPVDRRTDIYSFGTVLYELITGTTPFSGETRAIILDGILNRKPTPIRELTPATPQALAAIIEHALQKDPVDRYQSAAAIRDDLEALSTALYAPDSHAALKRLSQSQIHLRNRTRTDPTGTRQRRIVRLIVAAAVLLAAALAGYLGSRHKNMAKPVTIEAPRLPRQLTFASVGTDVQSSGISPDGKYIAYGDVTGFYLRLIATSETRKLAITKYVSALCWTPDAGHILISEGAPGLSSTYVSVISTASSIKSKLLDHAFVDQGCAAGNARVALIRTDLAQIWTIGVNGEQPRKVMDVPAEHRLLSTTLSPDGKWLAAVVDADNTLPAIEICSANSGPGQSPARACTTVVQDSGLISRNGLANIAWDHQEHLFYAQSDPAPSQYNSHVWSVDIDASGHPASKRTQLLSLAGEFPVDLSFTSDDKHFAYTGARFITKLSRADLDGGKLLSERSLIDEQPYEAPFAWTPDGKNVISFSVRPEGLQLLRRDADTGSAQTLALGSVHHAAAMTGDGRWILYVAGTQKSKEAPASILRVPVKGGLPELVLDHTSPVAVSCASTPRCILVESHGDESVVSDLDPLKGRGQELLRIQSGASEVVALSSDGQQILYGHPQRDQSLTLYDLRTRQSTQIHIEKYGNIDRLSFAPDGRSFYLSSWLPGALVKVGLDGHAQLLRGTPNAISGYALSQDGKQIIIGEAQIEANIWLADRQ